MIGSLHPVHTSAETQSHPTIGGSPVMMVLSIRSFSLCRCSVSLVSSLSLRRHLHISLLFSLPPYSWYELLRARCLDRCGLVGRMVRWLVERPSPDPPAASIPIASFCLLPRLSDRAQAHKYGSRIYSRLFSIHFNAQSCNASRAHAERPPFTLANVSRWWSACESHRGYLLVQCVINPSYIYIYLNPQTTTREFLILSTLYAIANSRETHAMKNEVA